MLKIFGFIHRDLKSVYDTNDGTIKIIDFGFCTDKLNVQSILGTERYVAPEIANCERPKISSKSDLYSLGRVL